MKRQTVSLAARRDKDSAVVKRSKDRSRFFAAQTTNGRDAFVAPFTTDAVDRIEMPRTPYRS